MLFENFTLLKEKITNKKEGKHIDFSVFIWYNYSVFTC